MKQYRKCLALLLTLALVLPLVACGDTKTPAASSKPGASTSTPSGSGETDLPKMAFTVASSAASANASFQIQQDSADAIAAKTDGNLTFNLLWDATLGSDSELIENCMAGSVPVISLASSPLLSYIPEIAVFDMPAVYTSAEAAYEGIAQFKETFAEILEAKNLKILGVGFQNFRGLSSSVDLSTPEGLKGMSIRTMENKYHMAFWSNLGASPTPLAFSELYLSLQQGLVQAQDNPINAVYASKFYEVQDNYMPITAFPFVNFVLMNKDTYDALPEEYKTLSEEFADVYLRESYLQNEQIEADAFAACGDGIEKLEYTDEFKAAMRTAAEPVWEQIAADIGSEITDAYLATGK